MAEHLTSGFWQGNIEGRVVSARMLSASALHRRLLPIFKALFMTANPIAVKAAVTMLGLDVGTPRLPLVPAQPTCGDDLPHPEGNCAVSFIGDYFGAALGNGVPPH